MAHQGFGPFPDDGSSNSSRNARQSLDSIEAMKQNPTYKNDGVADRKHAKKRIARKRVARK